MKWSNFIFYITTTVVFLNGCATGQPRGWVDAAAWGANYTEDYIYDYWIKTVDGKDTGVGGVQVHEFSKGGKGGRICCSPMPGVGQTIKIVWHVGGRREPESQWKTYSRDVVVAGATSSAPNTMNFVIIRFFPGYDVEAEFVSESTKFDGKASPRVDQLFYGRRVMRIKGE
jgi:hypothetical protein